MVKSYKIPVTKMSQRIALLGSTGSIGTQTLEIIRASEGVFGAEVLTANSNWEQLARQAVEFMPDSVVIADEKYYRPLSDALGKYPIKVYAGAESLEQVVVGSNTDVVVNALVGYPGMMPSVAAVKAGKKLALANKESLVVAGKIIMEQAAANNAPIIPVDSEHSAIFQSLVGEVSPVRRLILTASGGPFRRTPAAELAGVTVEQTLQHPNWEMGAKITVDSATLVNKGFEVIEAHWLFGLPADKIDVIVHPQSVVHSMVEFEDGAIKAQLGTPDMRLPIQYALTFPARIDFGGERFDFMKNPSFTFEPVDEMKFPALGIAYDCLRRGGTAPCVLNAANDVAVAAFLAGRIGYRDIVNIIEKTLAKAGFVAVPSLDDLVGMNSEAGRLAESFL